MKTKSTILIPVLAGTLFLFSSASAQESSIKPLPVFGFGMHVEQFRFGEMFSTDDLNISPVNTFVLTLNIDNVFRIEPEFGVYSQHNKNSDLSSNLTRFGVGIYGMFQKGNVNFNAGVTIRSISLSEEHMTTSGYPAYSPYKVTDEESWFAFGPSIEGEYFFSRHFSLGGNIAILFSSVNNTPGEPNATAIKSSAANTSTGLNVRFYF